MKILIIMDAGIKVPPVGYGGHERLVEMMATEYLNLGHSVDLLVTEGSAVDGCRVYSIGKEGFPPKNIVKYTSIFRTWIFLLGRSGQYDVIHNFGRLIFLLFVLNTRVKKIMTYGRIINSRNIKIINKLPNKNLIFTAASNWCVNTGNISGNWRTVYNCIDFSKYTLNEKLKEEESIIFLSRMDELKGAIDAITVAKRLGKKLILAGNISNLKNEKEYFERVLKPEIDNENVIYVGALDDKGKNYYLGKSSVFLFPAKTQEAFGMVMIESMACGTPVIAYNHSAMPEVITDGITGFVVDNIEEMINKVKDALLLDRKKVRSYAMEKFDSSKIASTYMSILDNNK